MAAIFLFFYFASDPLFGQRGSGPNQIQHAPDPLCANFHAFIRKCTSF